jgi:hypothetical protein
MQSVKQSAILLANELAFDDKLIEPDVCLHRRLRPVGHRLSRCQLSKSMPEEMLKKVNAEHEDMISRRSSEIRSLKYPEAQSMPPPAKFSRARSRLSCFHRTRSANSVEFLFDCFSESLSQGEGANRSRVDFDDAGELIRNPDDSCHSAHSAGWRGTELASAWESIMGLEKLASPPSDMAHATPRNECA